MLTILRSPWHRLVLAVSAGVALALSMVTLDASTMAPDGVSRVPMRAAHALAMQFVVLAIVLAGVRVAASAPAELRASWVLRLLETDRPGRWMAGFRSAVFVSLVVPVVALMGVAMACSTAGTRPGRSGWPQASSPTPPSTCCSSSSDGCPSRARSSGKSGDARIRGPLMVALFTILVVPVAELVTLALRTGLGTAVVLASGLAAIALLRWRGHVAIARGGGLSFEPEDRGTQALGIQP